MLGGDGNGGGGELSGWEEGEILTNYDGLIDGGGSKLSS
jgi:hypothetical protein